MIIYKVNNPSQYNDNYSCNNYKLENTKLPDPYSFLMNVKQQQLQNMHTIPKNCIQVLIKAELNMLLFPTQTSIQS